MDQESIAAELDALADRADAELLDRLPRDQNSRFALFTEATRVVDYTCVITRDDTVASRPQFERLQCGWNLATGRLFESLPQPYFPIRESTDDWFEFAGAMLHHFGSYMLVRRGALMLRGGLMECVRDGENFTIRRHGGTLTSHSLDE